MGVEGMGAFLLVVAEDPKAREDTDWFDPVLGNRMLN